MATSSVGLAAMTWFMAGRKMPDSRAALGMIARRHFRGLGRRYRIFDGSTVLSCRYLSEVHASLVRLHEQKPCGLPAREPAQDSEG
jgi:hypothetical protein